MNSPRTALDCESPGLTRVAPDLPRHESPSLAASAGTDVPAFEVKFLLPEMEARAVESRVRGVLALDPYADPALGDAYRVTGVYFDTPRFDVYHRADGYRARKYRLRRYGAAPAAFLERKSKRAGQVKKRRTPVPLPELREINGTVREEWPGAWFALQLAQRQLQPVCRVTYERVAFVGTSADGPIRVTFDRAARGLPASGLHLEAFPGGVALLTDEVIVEFKFLGAMPQLFKGLIEEMRLTPRPCSKYRRCVEAAGIAPPNGRGGTAGNA